MAKVKDSVSEEFLARVEAFNSHLVQFLRKEGYHEIADTFERQVEIINNMEFDQETVEQWLEFMARPGGYELWNQLVSRLEPLDKKEVN